MEKPLVFLDTDVLISYLRGDLASGILNGHYLISTMEAILERQP